MRLWSLHPKYLDAKGLVALWREALLAQAVLSGLTRGYLNHPQLIRFRQHPTPLAAMGDYLWAVHQESKRRGYHFDQTKIREHSNSTIIPVNDGQVKYEWQHLLAKLKARSPSDYDKYQYFTEPEVHPVFKVCPGGVESWERT
jgi:hypothetical protein